MFYSIAIGFCFFIVLLDYRLNILISEGKCLKVVLILLPFNVTFKKKIAHFV